MNPNCKFPLRGNCELAGCMRYRIGKVNCEENIKPIVFESDPVIVEVKKEEPKPNEELFTISDEDENLYKEFKHERNNALWVCIGNQAYFNLKS